MQQISIKGICHLWREQQLSLAISWKYSSFFSILFDTKGYSEAHYWQTSCFMQDITWWEKQGFFFLIENRTFWDYIKSLLVEKNVYLMFNKFLEVSIAENNYFNIILGDIKEKIMNNLIFIIRNYEDMGIKMIVFLFYCFLFSF